MQRLFIALDLPDSVKDQLLLLGSGIPGARWCEHEQFHLTLRFLGELDGREAGELDEALEQMPGTPFTLKLKGVDCFPRKGEPKVLWAGVEPCRELKTLHDRLDRLVLESGLDPDARKFTPHITLARLDRSPVQRVQRFLLDHLDFESPPFEVTEFHVYSSVRHTNGSHYSIEKTYPLGKKSELPEDDPREIFRKELSARMRSKRRS